MTVEQFLARLRKTSRTWQVGEFGQIRNFWGECPITAVHGNRLYAGTYLQAARELGLGEDEAEVIAVAADNRVLNARYTYELRDKLLKACGIKE